MKLRIGRIIKYYSSIITGSLPLFIAAGLIATVFSNTGWQLDKTAYGMSMSQLLYSMVIPAVMGYTAGKKCGGEPGGVSGALAACTVIMAEPVSTVMGAVICGGLAGFLYKEMFEKIQHKIPAGFELLARNLLALGAGAVSGFLAYICFVPILTVTGVFLCQGLDWMLAKKMLPLISMVVEPVKILFLNNWINHGLFVPLGVEQVRTGGQSILFLIETNPGPGFGILAAYKLTHRNEKNEASSCMIIQLLGGIHEVYFPYILADMRLLAAVGAGGIAGNFCFMMFGSGLSGPASPGSVLTLLLMADKTQWLGLLAGIAVSAAVSGLAAVFLMTLKRRSGNAEEPIRLTAETNAETKAETQIKAETQTKAEAQAEVQTEEKNMRICFVCDAGIGSSAMSAALFRKRMKAMGISGVEVLHAASDEIPEETDLLVCQKDYAARLPELQKECLTVESLTDLSCYAAVFERIKRGN